MKSDLDALMQDKDIDALLITGPASHNAAMHYFTGNVHLTNGSDLVKAQGKQPVLYYHSLMEREEAAKTGLDARSAAKGFDFKAAIQAAEGDVTTALAQRYIWMLAESGVTRGRVAVYGKAPIGSIFAILKKLEELAPDLEIVGEVGGSILGAAMETKDEAELEELRMMGRVTVEVVDKVAKFLQSHKVEDEILVKEDGSPLTIGDVKTNINAWAIQAGVENPLDCIFAIGRDAGIPHAVGNPADVLKLGETIVFDIFLQQPGGGYFGDFTRTWCLGYAPPEAQKLYDDVRHVFDDIMGGIEANAPFKALYERSQDLFEAQGHTTTRQDPTTTDGYVHSLGHGIGLEIHEGPSSGNQEALLRPGVAVTIEPGLYYPEQGLGCRIEDSIYVHPNGDIEVLAEYPHDLVLEMGE